MPHENMTLDDVIADLKDIRDDLEESLDFLLKVQGHVEAFYMIKNSRDGIIDAIEELEKK